jgi:N-acetylglucosaminyldiphosphoundecaprenol N-acetyl-beta-D-mannosaminyltransferase
VAGIGVDPLTRAELLGRVAELVNAGERSTVAYVNVHVHNEAMRHADLRAFLTGAALCYCDGNGIVWGARALGGALPERMTGADWIWDFAAMAEGRWRVFWMGGEPGVAERAAEVLRERHPGLSVATEHGFHTNIAPVLAKINAYQPHILLVGMGTPTQERWVARWREALDVPVVWVLGATHDFVAGNVPRGPAWLHTDHEWLARLVADPKRLWRRYLLGNTRFIARILFERVRQRAS